ncbi:MAG: hypothetical protein HPY66_3484 [Firmicutes bacterium]|nr:hypothetical protein [Bacillota bacterium]MDI6706049.1 hypothetical protein [Bacillota bacterium]
MSGRISDLLETIYAELQEIKEIIKENSDDISKLRAKIDNGIPKNVDTLFETREITNNRLEQIENKIDKLSMKVERHAVKIQVSGKGKKKTF